MQTSGTLSRVCDVIFIVAVFLRVGLNLSEEVVNVILIIHYNVIVVHAYTIILLKC